MICLALGGQLISQAPQVILLTVSRGKSLLLLNCPLVVQYNNSECRPTKFSLRVLTNTFFFSFTIKLLYCQKSQIFKFVYMQNNLYRQKDHKKTTYRALLRLLWFLKGFLSYCCYNSAIFLGTGLKIHFQTLITQ